MRKLIIFLLSLMICISCKTTESISPKKIIGWDFYLTKDFNEGAYETLMLMHSRPKAEFYVNVEEELAVLIETNSTIDSYSSTLEFSVWDNTDVIDKTHWALTQQRENVLIVRQEHGELVENWISIDKDLFLFLGPFWTISPLENNWQEDINIFLNLQTKIEFLKHIDASNIRFFELAEPGYGTFYCDLQNTDNLNVLPENLKATISAQYIYEKESKLIRYIFISVNVEDINAIDYSIAQGFWDNGENFIIEKPQEIIEPTS